HRALRGRARERADRSRAPAGGEGPAAISAAGRDDAGAPGGGDRSRGGDDSAPDRSGAGGRPTFGGTHSASDRAAAMNGWDALARECDAWSAADRPATWWWRDDDAIEPTPALAELAALAPAGLALAVIPQRMKPELGAFLARHPGIAALQHGFAHVNHARGDERKSEFPESRDPEIALAELAEGRRGLIAVLGERALPVLTPPWNRASEGLLA